ncbi:MAG: hypothetical protein LH473_03920, partial [Chitinophagales bacterium]|nr:hypothetical protein [Chitinophagales bacterium]
MNSFSYINNADPAYIESLYQDFKKDPSSVDVEWKKFFEGFDFAMSTSPSPTLPPAESGINSGERVLPHENQQDIIKKVEKELKRDDIREHSSFKTNNGENELNKERLRENNSFPFGEGRDGAIEFQVARLITNYRLKSHLISNTNPIRKRKDRHANLDLEFLGLKEEDLQKEFYAGELLRLGKTSLKNIVEHLQKVYCRSIGVEYMYITNPDELIWFQQQFENGYSQLNFPLDQKKRILEKLTDAVVFEKFLGTKYIGQKRFSLEGGETTIAALDAIINKASEFGVVEITMGMAHRGRLNVLANIMGKTYENIFSEFEGNVQPDTTMGDGDVKYHLGFSSELQTTTGNKIHLKLSPNPS